MTEKTTQSTNPFANLVFSPEETALSIMHADLQSSIKTALSKHEAVDTQASEPQQPSTKPQPQ